MLSLCLYGIWSRAASAAARSAPPGDVSRLELKVGLAKPGGGYTIVNMPLETYVARVVAGEAARGSRPAALDALAITVRTFALANRGRHRPDGFDLCDQTHCQVVRAATAATERAAAETAARVLLSDGALASIYYTASCGGRTEIPSAVWPGAEDPPYLPSQPDDACAGTPAWTAEIGRGDLLRALQAGGFSGRRLRDMRVLAHDGSGRVSQLRLDGLSPDTISGQDLRLVVGRTLGWQLVKSTAFELDRDGDAYRFSGHGSGHGVGLCVIGSAHLAESGVSAERILARYFPGLEIATLAPAPVAASTTRVPVPAPARPAVANIPRAVPHLPDGVLVSLPDEDEGELSAIAALAARARDTLAATLGVPAPPRVTLRFHPTTIDFERATGQAWFESAAVIGGEVHLLPVTILRDRGVLDRTVRHGLVHLFVDGALARRPLWVREGAASYFAEETESARSQPGGRVSCPDDAELARPVSVGALTNAYARARACFARQIASGKSWRDVK